MKLLLKILQIGLLILLTATSALAFDDQHSVFDKLLKKHVKWDTQGVASKVNYAGFQQDSVQLRAYLEGVSAVNLAEFNGWEKAARLAFLINAYNAFTIQFILSDYPDITSIKDLGSIFSSPWSKELFPLFGKKRSLDHIEHKIIRAPGAYDDPRIHSALVCASIGCPGIRNEAFTGSQLEQQLEDSLRRFLSDRSRNRYNAQNETLEVSKIFDWYGDDFTKGFRGQESLKAFLGDYSDLLADLPADQNKIAQHKIKVEFLDYDWQLNKTAP